MTDQVPGLSQPSQRAPFRRPTSTHPGPRSSTTAHRRLWRDAPGDVVARGQRHAGMTSSIAIRCRCARACVPDWGAAPSCVRPLFVTGDLPPHTVRTRFGRSRNSRRRVAVVRIRRTSTRVVRPAKVVGAGGRRVAFAANERAGGRQIRGRRIFGFHVRVAHESGGLAVGVPTFLVSLVRIEIPRLPSPSSYSTALPTPRAVRTTRSLGNRTACS